MFLTWIDQFLRGLYRALTGDRLPATHHRDGELLLCLMGITCMAFGFELTNPTLGIDDYSHLLMPVHWQAFWISRGMWGALALQSLLPGGWITPFIELVAGIFLQCLSALALCWLLQVRELSYGQRFLACAVYTTFPYFAAQMAFSYLQIGYPLASLLCIAALVLSRATTVWRSLLAVVLIAFAISIYQGCIGVLITSVILYPIFAWLNPGANNKGNVRTIGTTFFRMGCVIVAGAALYYLAHKAILAYTGLSSGEGYYSVEFNVAFWRRWASIEGDIQYLLLGSNGLVPHIAQLLFLLALGFVVVRVSFSRSSRVSLTGLMAAITALVVVLASPFIVILLHAGSLAPRSAMGVAILWLAGWALAQKLANSRATQTIVSAAAVVVLLTFTFQNNRMFYAEYLVEQADRLTINRIAERVAMLEAQNGERNIKGIVVQGSFSYPATPAMVRYCGSVLGYSRLEWPTDTPQYAVATLAKIHGIEQYPSYDATVFTDLMHPQDLVTGRRPWPHADAVFLHDGYAVVWLGERSTACGETSFGRWLGSWLPGA